VQPTASQEATAAIAEQGCTQTNSTFKILILKKNLTTRFPKNPKPITKSNSGQLPQKKTISLSNKLVTVMSVIMTSLCNYHCYTSFLKAFKKAACFKRLSLAGKGCRHRRNKSPFSVKKISP